MILKDVEKIVSLVKYLKIEQQRILRKIEELETESERTSPTLTGMPSACGEFDKIGMYVGLIAEQKERLMKNRLDLSCAEKSRDTFFQSIQDEMICQALKLKYIDGYSWSRVARIIGNNTPDSVRMSCIRYLKRL